VKEYTVTITDAQTGEVVDEIECHRLGTQGFAYGWRSKKRGDRKARFGSRFTYLDYLLHGGAWLQAEQTES